MKEKQLILRDGKKACGDLFLSGFQILRNTKEIQSQIFFPTRCVESFANIQDRHESKVEKVESQKIYIKKMALVVETIRSHRCLFS